MDTTNKKYKLFLDDVRNVRDAASYMHMRIGPRNPIYLEDNWFIAKCYQDFVDIVTENGIPEFVSYDHDLSDEHYVDGDIGVWKDNYKEKSGFECAKWLKDYCRKAGIQHPEFAVHSQNPIGYENIMRLLK